MSRSLVLLFLAALVHAGQLAITLEQKAISITGKTRDSATLSCKIVGPKFDHIHWYRYQKGKGLERLLHYSMSKSKSTLDPGFSTDKISAYKIKKDTCGLIVSNLELSDSGTYHCASWDGPVKVFSEGTRLIVTQSAIQKKPPKPIFFLPTSEEVKQKQSGTYICLLEDFYPNVVKTYWTEDGSTEPLDAQVGQITGDGNSYSQVSWLTVKEDMLRKNLTYFYQHEDVGMEPKAVSISSVWEKVFSKEPPPKTCNSTQAKTTGLRELHLVNMSAYYTYIILLVKSMTYFTVILFFLYQKRVGKSSGAK